MAHPEASAKPRPKNKFKKKIEVRKPAASGESTYIYGCRYSGLAGTKAEVLFEFPLPTSSEPHHPYTFSNRPFELKIDLSPTGALSLAHVSALDPDRPIVLTSHIDGFDSKRKLYPKFSFTVESPFANKSYGTFVLECE
jgi:hypothetical protein